MIYTTFLDPFPVPKSTSPITDAIDILYSDTGTLYLFSNMSTSFRFLMPLIVAYSIMPLFWSTIPAAAMPIALKLLAESRNLNSSEVSEEFCKVEFLIVCQAQGLCFAIYLGDNKPIRAYTYTYQIEHAITCLDS